LDYSWCRRIGLLIQFALLAAWALRIALAWICDIARFAEP
jgi:hypothetical protein